MNRIYLHLDNFFRSPPGLSGHSPGNSLVGSPPVHREHMDDLADAFAGSFTVTNTPNDTNRPHPRFAQYKMKSSGMNQVHLNIFLWLLTYPYYQIFIYFLLKTLCVYSNSSLVEAAHNRLLVHNGVIILTLSDSSKRNFSINTLSEPCKSS